MNCLPICSAHFSAASCRELGRGWCFWAMYASRWSYLTCQHGEPLWITSQIGWTSSQQLTLWSIKDWSYPVLRLWRLGTCCRLLTALLPVWDDRVLLRNASVRAGVAHFAIRGAGLEGDQFRCFSDHQFQFRVGSEWLILNWTWFDGSSRYYIRVLT